MSCLLYLLFYDAFSDHACVFLCVSMHLEAELPTPQETPPQRFFLGIGPCGLVPPLPLEVEFHSLVTAVLITPKGAESPGSRRIGVIGALVLILPSETV